MALQASGPIKYSEIQEEFGVSYGRPENLIWTEIFNNYDQILDIILPTLGKERRETYSPFLPICKTAGKVLQAKVIKLDKKNMKTVTNNSNRSQSNSSQK